VNIAANGTAALLCALTGVQQGRADRVLGPGDARTAPTIFLAKGAPIADFARAARAVSPVSIGAQIGRF
jgi:hypothetical protein